MLLPDTRESSKISMPPALLNGCESRPEVLMEHNVKINIFRNYSFIKIERRQEVPLNHF
jgi:hypothetical protein